MAPKVCSTRECADADEDTALALLFAARQWGEAPYRTAALELLSGFWTQGTATVAGQRVVVGGPWAQVDHAVAGAAVINPSYFAPYAYRIFAEVDPTHPWSDLVDSSYNLLARTQETPALGGSAGIPNWMLLDAATGGSPACRWRCWSVAVRL